jgi:hypothetical protein
MCLKNFENYPNYFQVQELLKFFSEMSLVFLMAFCVSLVISQTLKQREYWTFYWFLIFQAGADPWVGGLVFNAKEKKKIILQPIFGTQCDFQM